MKEVDGYGPFKKNFAFLDWKTLSEKGIWANTEIEISGVPEKWAKSNVVQIWFDANQFAFQNYKLGNLNEEFFNELKESWKIDLLERNLSEKPINCFVHITIGKTYNDKLEYVIDTNNDKDFSDEQIQNH